MSDKNTPVEEALVETPVENPTAPGTPLGELGEGEMKAVSELRQASRDLTTEIGTLEVRKARLLGNLGEIERRAQDILKSAGERLGVEEGTAWHVTPEGKAFYGIGG